MKEILYDWGGANAWLFTLINGIHGEALDGFMLTGTWLGEHSHFPAYLALTALVGLLAVAGKKDGLLEFREQAVAWLLLLAVFSGAYVLDGFLVGWLKGWFDFPRPPAALPPGMVHVVGTAEFHHSLPSGHASFAMLVAASLWPMLKPWAKWVALFFVAWVALSRISLGFHFPADVTAGALSSLLVVVLVRRVLEWAVTTVQLGGRPD